MPNSEERVWRHQVSTSRLDKFDFAVEEPPVVDADKIDFFRKEGEFAIGAEALAFASRILPRASISMQESPARISLAGIQSTLPQLPKEYAVKGGLVRHLLFEAIFGTKYPAAPRDIDLARFDPGSLHEDARLASIFMPRDAERGAGVEIIATFQKYFSSRDISINEAIWLDERILATPRAVVDMSGLILRPCKVRFGSLHRDITVSGRTILKMVRLGSEGALAGIPWRLVGLPREVAVSEFDLAIELGKCFERSEACASKFVETLDAIGLLPPFDGDNALEAIVEDLVHFTVGERAPLHSVPERLRWKRSP